MICTKCGNIIGDGNTICGRCGTPIVFDENLLDQVQMDDLGSDGVIFFTMTQEEIKLPEEKNISEGNAGMFEPDRPDNIRISPFSDSEAVIDNEPVQTKPADIVEEDNSKKLIFSYIVSTKKNLNSYKPDIKIPEISESHEKNPEFILRAPNFQFNYPESKDNPGIPEKELVLNDAYNPDFIENSEIIEGRENMKEILIDKPKVDTYKDSSFKDVEPINMKDFLTAEELAPNGEPDNAGNPDFDQELKPVLFRNHDEDDPDYLFDEDVKYSPKDEQITSLGWLGIFLLLLIPGVNIVLLTLWALGFCKKWQKTTFARGIVLLGVLAYILYLLFSTVLNGFYLEAVGKIPYILDAVNNFVNMIFGYIQGLIR